MPYIKQEDRQKFDAAIDLVEPKTAGELNYCVTRLVLGFLKRDKISYFTLNQVVGVLECAKQELYRRLVAPYEDVSATKNGDVYPIIRPPAPVQVVTAKPSEEQAAEITPMTMAPAALPSVS